MKRTDILKQLEPSSDSENRIFIPNEIFDDISQNDEIKGSSHKALAYCFYCLISYLYRYATYGSVTIADFKLNIETLKVILGYGRKYIGIDYITKKRGVLDKMGYTKTTRKIPVHVDYYDKSDKLLNTILNDFKYSPEDIDYIEFVYDHEFEHIEKLNHEIKYPVKAFYREPDSDSYDGTFFIIDKTHSFDMRIFLHAMKHKKEIGVEGFYLYQFINRHKKHTIEIPLTSLSKRTGIAETSLNEYLKWLEKYNYISNSHDKYIMGAPHDERKSCTYVTNKFEAILDIPNEEREIRKVERYVDDEAIQEYFDKKNQFVVEEYDGEENEEWT